MNGFDTLVQRNLLNYHGFYFRGCWECIDMVDHLVPGKQGHRSASIFLQFCNTCSKHSQIKLLADGLPNFQRSWAPFGKTRATLLKSAKLSQLTFLPSHYREAGIGQTRCIQQCNILRRASLRKAWQWTMKWQWIENTSPKGITTSFSTPRLLAIPFTAPLTRDSLHSPTVNSLRLGWCSTDDAMRWTSEDCKRRQ